MFKRLNLFILALLLVGQTILGPMTATAEVMSPVDESTQLEYIEEQSIPENNEEGGESEQSQATNQGETVEEPDLDQEEVVKELVESDENQHELTENKNGSKELEQVDTDEVDAIESDDIEQSEETSNSEDEPESDVSEDMAGEQAEDEQSEESVEEDEIDSKVQEAFDAAKLAIEKALQSEKKADIEKALGLIEAVEDEELQAELIELAAPLMELMARPAAEIDDEFFKLEIGDVIGPNGQSYGPDNPYKPGDRFELQLDWKLLNGHGYKDGDYRNFNIPEELHLPNDFSGELKNDAGEVVATYKITTEGVVTLTFTDFIEGHSEVTGWIKLQASLNENNVEEEDGHIVISPIGEEGEIRIPIDPAAVDKTVEKQGTPNKGYNADEIEWTVTINKNANSLKGVTLEDVLPEGTEYIDGSLKVVKQAATINGTPVGKTTEVTVTPSATSPLTIPLGDISEVYTITYTTKVTEEGLDLTEFKNKVTFKAANLEDTVGAATVTINRGKPIGKATRSAYDPKTGILGWQLDFNFNQKSLNNVTLSDSWAGSKAEGKLEIDLDSVKFIEVTIDDNGHATEGEAKTPSEIGANLTVNENGFEISRITTNKPYRVVYNVKVKGRELDGFRIVNEAGFADYTTGKIGYNIYQYVGKKAVGEVNYAKKTIPWTIEVNMDERQMNDLEISDTLGAGLTLVEGSVKVTIGGEEYKDFDLDASSNPFKITNLGSTDKHVVVTYETSFDPNELPKGYNAYNTAHISWIPEGSSERINLDVNAGTELNDETANPSWKSATYNPDTKEITWTIIANYRENEYADFKIVDEPQDNQKLLTNTIEVYELTINPNGSISEGEKLENITPEITGNGFTLNIGATSKAYGLTYKTSVANLVDLQNEYKNEAQVLDGDDLIAKLQAKTSVYGDKRYGDKRGHHQSGSKTVEWSIDVNIAQQTIANLQLVDTITDNQEYLEDTIKVYEANLEKNGENYRLVKGDELDASSYELTVEGSEFTITWNEKVDRPYIVEYSTLFFAGTGDKVGNNYQITGDGVEETDGSSNSNAETEIGYLSSGGATGTAGYLVIQKLDTTLGEDNARPLAGIEFELIDPETGKVIKTVTTDEDGYADFGRLLYGDYKLHEVNPPEGYETPDQDKIIKVDKEFTSESDPLDYVQTIENYKDIEVIEIPVEKVWNGQATESVTIKLLANGEEVDSVKLSDDNDWKHNFVVVKHDEDGNDISYTIEEVVVDGYDVAITGNANEGFTVTNTQTGETAVSVEKVWKLFEKEATAVTVNLLVDGEVVADVELSDANEWKHEFTELDKFDSEGNLIDYTVEEVEIDGFEIDITGDAEEGFTITNTEIVELYPIEPITKVDVEKVWKDNNNAEETRPYAISVKLFADGAEVTDVELLDDNDWKHTFNSLPKFSDKDFENLIEYTVEEVEVEGYKGEVEATEEGFVITNTLTKPIIPIQPITKVDVEKVWEDKDNKHEVRPDAITVNLLADGEKVDTIELSDDNNWKHTFNSLPKFSDKDFENLIEYTVEEVEVAEYKLAITGDQEEGYTITNTVKDYAIGDYVWVDRNKDGIQDENEEPLEGVKVELYDEEGNKIAETETDENGRYIFDELLEGNYKVKFELTDEQKEQYRFTQEQAGDDTTVDSDADEETGWTRDIVLNDENEQLTKDYDRDFNATEGIDPTWDAGVVELVQIPVEKVWKDNNNAEESRPEAITVHVLANGEVVETVEVTAETGWAHIFKGLDKYDGNGEEIDYTVEEEAVESYKGEVEATEEGFVITNTLTKPIIPIQPITKVDVEKVWEDKDNKHEVRPDAITVNLLADGEIVDSIELSEDNNWKHTFNSLPKFSDKDFENLIEYTVEEVEVAEYKSAITGDQEEGYTITNTVKDYAIGDYVWIDKNKDGIQDPDEEPLEGVKVELFDENGDKVAETTTDENGRYIFDELPAGKYKVKFTLTEEQAKKYKFTKQNAGKDSTNDSDADENGWTTEITLNENNEQLTQDYANQTFKATEGIDPTWDAGVIELIDITVTKSWNDENDSIRPESITINLLANGAVVGEYEVTAEQDWTRTITGLDKYDTAGKEIVYTITEHDVPGYQSAIDGFNITNTRADEKSITMTKTWLDDNAKDRPTSIEVELFRSIAEGEKESVGTYNVTAENNWTLTIDELPSFDANGQSYTYEIAELEVDGYQSIVNGFDLTNVREGLTSVEIEKVWKGDTDQNRPGKITVDLLQNGKVVTTIELTKEADWTFTVDNLPAFDEKGLAYAYTVVEHEVKGYESAITSKGNTFTITNTFIEEEKPVDPKPENPKPTEPKPEDPKPVEPNEKGDGTLPNTATHTFNYLLIGFVLLVLGSATLFIRKRRNE